MGKFLNRLWRDERLKDRVALVAIAIILGVLLGWRG